MSGLLLTSPEIYADLAWLAARQYEIDNPEEWHELIIVGINTWTLEHVILKSTYNVGRNDHFTE